MKTVQKSVIILIFGIFFIFLLLQFNKVILCYDDYAYLSLTYGEQNIEGVTGSDYNFMQMIKFIAGHYKNVSGRIVYISLFLFSYMMGGLTLVRFIIALSVFLAFLLAYGLTLSSIEEAGCQCSEWFPTVLALFIVSAYGLMPINLQRSCTYWFSAAFLYIVPAFVFFLFAKTYYGTLTKSTHYSMALSVIFAILVSCAHEQWLVAALTFTFAIGIYRWTTQKKISVFDIAVFLSALAGGLPIFTSPAVSQRMLNNIGYMEGTFLSRILGSGTEVVRVFFSSFNLLYLFLLLGMMALMGIYLALRDKQRVRRIIHAAFTASCAAEGIFSLVTFRILNIYRIYSCPVLLFLFIFILFMSAEILYFCHTEKARFLMFLYIAAFGATACLILVPEIPHRVFVPFIFLMFPIMGFIFCRVMMQRYLRWLGGAALFVYMVTAGMNTARIYSGYSRNYDVGIFNESEIIKGAEEYKNGGDITQIELGRFPDWWCTYMQPYYPAREYTEYWIKYYYDCPAELEFHYNSPEEIAALAEKGKL